MGGTARDPRVPDRGSAYLAHAKQQRKCERYRTSMLAGANRRDWRSGEPRSRTGCPQLRSATRNWQKRGRHPSVLIGMAARFGNSESLVENSVRKTRVTQHQMRDDNSLVVSSLYQALKTSSPRAYTGRTMWKTW